MAKKQKHKGSKKAVKQIKKHGPIAGAAAAVGGVLSAIAANEGFRAAVRELAEAGVARLRTAIESAQRMAEDATAKAKASSRRKDETRVAEEAPMNDDRPTDVGVAPTAQSQAV